MSKGGWVFTINQMCREGSINWGFRVLLPSTLKGTQHAAWWSYGSLFFQTETTTDIKIVRSTEVCGKV